MTPSLHETVSHTTNASCDDAFLLPPTRRGHTSSRLMKPKFLSGWRIGALLSLFGAISVFLLNMILIIWVWKSSIDKIQEATGTLFKGSCTRVRQLNVWAHLLVNILSTLLLCASNYCMQVLIAPNRADLNRAHANRQWLHIGVPAPHNLTRIASNRALLWILLMLSSLPLHLLYNSIMFTNLQANDYVVISTQENWLYGAPYDFTGFVDFPEDTLKYFRSTLTKPDINETVTLNDGKTALKYKNISTSACFNEYNNQYVSNVGNVYLIQSRQTVWRNLKFWNFSVNDVTGDHMWYTGSHPPGNYTMRDIQDPKDGFPFISRPASFPSNGWRCPSHSTSSCNVDDPKEVPKDRSKWEPYESPIRYCMVEQVGEICQLRFSFRIAGIVIVANLVKIMCIGSMLYNYEKHDALVTLGDAIASFLECSDPETRLRCLQSVAEIKKSRWNKGTGRRSKLAKRQAVRETRFYQDPFDIEIEAKPKRYKLEFHRWASAASDSRWVATYMFYLFVLVFGVVCSALSLEGMPRSLSKLWEIGFGTVNGQNLFTIRTTLMGAVFLTNSPQLVLSYLYIAFNGLYTSMFIGQEWATYLTERKYLRVSAPVGQQRNTYWLSVPYRYAIPITVLSGLFHWLASQSLFMVQITVTQINTRAIDPNEQISTCGFSPLGIILTTTTGTVMALGGIIIGRFKYPVGMSLVASCSAAISAACHPPPEDVDASLHPVQWGAVTHGQMGRNGEEPVGHCTFSSFPVEPPIAGRLYA